jgi:hypothetical protein
MLLNLHLAQEIVHVHDSWRRALTNKMVQALIS